MLRCPALAGRITGVSRSVEPLVRHVLISCCLPPTSRAARTRAPPRPAPATAPPVPPPVRHRVLIRRQQHTHVVAPCLCRPLGTDNLLAKRRCATYGGTRRWPGRMSHRPTDAAAEREPAEYPRGGDHQRRRARRADSPPANPKTVGRTTQASHNDFSKHIWGPPPGGESNQPPDSGALSHFHQRIPSAADGAHRLRSQPLVEGSNGPGRRAPHLVQVGGCERLGEDDRFGAFRGDLGGEFGDLVDGASGCRNIGWSGARPRSRIGSFHTPGDDQLAGALETVGSLKAG